MPPMVCVVCPARHGEFGLAEPLSRPVPGEAGAPVHPAGGSSVAWSGSGRPESFSMLVSSAMATRARIRAWPCSRRRAPPESYWRRLSAWHVPARSASCGQLHPRSVRILRITVVPSSPVWGVSPVRRAGVDAEGLRRLPDLVGFERGQRGFAFLDSFDGRHIEHAGEPCEGLFDGRFPVP